MWVRILTTFVLLALASCGGGPPGGVIVASVYPLAYVAARVAPNWEVIDLTPPGTEAHDLELSFMNRNAIQEARLVVYLGDLGFQPQVEEAVRDTDAHVLSVADALRAHRSPVIPSTNDPHFWLNLDAIQITSNAVATTLAAMEESQSEGFRRRAGALAAELLNLDGQYRDALSDCALSTAIVTHEAFDYLGDRYGFEQFGLSGITPEAEPSAERLAEARELINSGRAGAVFYEERDDARRIAESLAEDAGVQALPLNTLESQPIDGDYFTVMEDNVDSLREGLQCR